MGALITLRDVESLERIGNQLQVSERLAALGRVTAGVAHEVKNPLNSMRLWLEVLKANMPVEPEPQQAVKMLDSEIDRLDRAVKTFLNFTKPLEIKLEETDLRLLLDDVLEAARPTITKAGIEHQSRRLHLAQPQPPRRFCRHRRSRFRCGHLSRKSKENLPAVFHHPPRR
jgi:signal transduction histidine kinase